MAEKPTDFFLGALDFFGILVPGAVLLAFAVVTYPSAAKSVADVLPLAGGERIAAFAVAAYLVGYLLHLLGFGIDRLYDATQQSSFERFYGRELYQRVMQLKREQLAAEDEKLIGAYRWALTNIRVRFPAWVADIDRMSAHTALFRSLTLIAIFGAVAEGVKRAWLQGILSAVIAVIYVRMYQHLRWRSIRIVYEYYVALNAIPKSSEQSNRDAVPTAKTLIE